MADISNAPLNKAVQDLLNLAGSGLHVEKKKGSVRIKLDNEIQESMQQEKGPETLEKAILKTLNQQGDAERLAFEVDPTSGRHNYLYKTKQRLVPDKLLKRIAIQDDLVAAIVQARQAHLSAFGRPRPDRFSHGFVIEARTEYLEKIEKIQDMEEKKLKKAELQQRIAKATKWMLTCGSTNLDLGGIQDKLTFPQYISMSVRNAVVLGRIATEVIHDRVTGKPSGFRVIDAGTILRAEPQRDAADAVRRQAQHLLGTLKGKTSREIDPVRFAKDEYTWIQVIEDQPMQAFTDKECLVHNFYAVPDIELDGYPVTPLDTVISAVTTHINITTHNKLYFQSGRAARGMLVFKSDDVDESIVSRIRQQFNAQINSVNNAWRMPVFAVGTDDDVVWQPIDSGGRDMEFQYLSDMNARVILSAFQMSPEELPGWSYLSRGTNNQSLSESNNEYKLEAGRDVGIRPLLAQFEDFINNSLLPICDPVLAEACVLKLVGLDAENAEKESVRLQQDAPVHMTYDEILEKVEKRAIGKLMGGEFPLNPQYQMLLDKYKTVGEIKEFFFGEAGASKDPQWAYVRDPFWFQWRQQMQAEQQMQMQMQQAQQQAAMGGPPPDDGSGGQGGPPPQDDGSGGGGPAPQGEGAKPTQETSPTEKQKSAEAEDASASPDLSRSVDQALGALSKAEKDLPPSRRKLLHKQRSLIDDFLRGWESDMEESTKEIMRVAGKLTPKKR